MCLILFGNFSEILGKSFNSKDKMMLHSFYSASEDFWTN